MSSPAGNIQRPWRYINRRPLLPYGVDPRGMWVLVLLLFVPNMGMLVVAVTVLTVLTIVERRGWSPEMGLRFLQSWLIDHRQVPGGW